MKKSKPKSALDYLRNRELGTCASMPHNDYRLFTALVMSDGRSYRKMETYTSSKRINYEADRVYLDHYRRAHSVIRRNLVYDLSATSLFQSNSKERIVDAEIYYLTSTSEPAAILRSELFVGLTDSHRLIVLDARSGELLKTFQLPPKNRGYRFSMLLNGNPNETLHVKGRKMNEANPMRPPHFVFAVFNLAPFKFCYSFIVDENIVGPFSNASISHDFMIFVRNRSVKFHRLEDVLGRVNESQEIIDGAELQPNVTLEWPCPCYFEIRVASETLETGGFPWCCLFKSPKPNEAEYRIQNIATKKEVYLENGQLRQTDPGRGMEVNVFFNPDASGTIIFVGENEIKKLRIADAGDASIGKSGLREIWTVSIDDSESVLEADKFICGRHLRSGRRANRSVWVRRDEVQYIHCVQYSSTMDVLVVVVYYEVDTSDSEFYTITPRRKCQWGGGRLKILLVDNISGRIRKEIKLDDPWRIASEEHQVELDDDILVHTIKHRSGKHACHVYRIAEAIETPKSNRRKRRKTINNHSGENDREINS